MPYAFEAHHMHCQIPLPDGSYKTIFSNIDCSARPGEIIDITGKSGCGKSTLLTAFARLNTYCTGALTLNNIPASYYSPTQWRTQVAYVPQQPMLIGETVADALRLPFTLRIHHAAHHTTTTPVPSDLELLTLLEQLGCADIELQRPTHELSGGQAARISLARTLLTQPKVLLADEVDAALDPENAHRISQILQHAATVDKLAIIRVRHSTDDGIATRVLIMDAKGLHHAN